MRHLTKLIVLILAFSLVGCGLTREVVLTPDQEAGRIYYEAKNSHNQALKIFTEMLTKYNVWCSNSEYAEACAKIDPLWVKAETALDTWDNIIDTREPLTGCEDDYRAALKQLKTKLLMQGFNALENK